MVSASMAVHVQTLPTPDQGGFILSSEPADQGKWTLRGNLTLRGWIRPVTVHVTAKDGWRRKTRGAGPALIDDHFKKKNSDCFFDTLPSCHRCWPRGCPNGQVAPWNIQLARRLANSAPASISAGNTARTVTGNLQFLSPHSHAMERNTRPLGSRPSRKPTGYCGSSYPYTCPHEEHANNDRSVTPSSGRRPLSRRIDGN